MFAFDAVKQPPLIQQRLLPQSSRDKIIFIIMKQNSMACEGGSVRDSLVSFFDSLCLFLHLVTYFCLCIVSQLVREIINVIHLKSGVAAKVIYMEESALETAASIRHFN